MSSSSAARLGPSPRAWLRLLGAWSLAVGLLIAAAWPVIATATPGTFATAIDLSKRATAQIKSAYPDIEASADGKYVATVWSRGYNAENDTKDYGYIFLKSALTGTHTADDGWENQVRVYAPTAEVWGVNPRAVFAPNDSGKLYVTWVGCGVVRSDTVSFQCNKIMAATCTLTGADTCSTLPQVYYAGSSELRSPDIAADNSGHLYVVWRNHTAGKIQYSRYSGGHWSTSPGDVAVDGGGNIFYNPALAWASGPGGNGRLHLAVYKFNSVPGSRRIQYSADTDLSNDTWDPGATLYWSAPSLVYEFLGDTGEPVVKPSIAAVGANVYIAWDVYKTDVSKFHLAYDCSTDSGASWENSSAEGLAIPGPFFSDTTTYKSPLSSIDEEDALRPSVAISGGAPAVAWHFKGSQEDTGIPAYLIAYRDSAGSCGSLTWNERIVATQNINYDPKTGTAYDDSANPDLAMSPGSGVHIAYMGMWGGNPTSPNSDWDIYYRGDIKTDNSTDDVGPVYLPIIRKNR